MHRRGSASNDRERGRIRCCCCCWCLDQGLEALRVTGWCRFVLPLRLGVVVAAAVAAGDVVVAIVADDTPATGQEKPTRL